MRRLPFLALLLLVTSPSMAQDDAFFRLGTNGVLLSTPGGDEGDIPTPGGNNGPAALVLVETTPSGVVAGQQWTYVGQATGGTQPYSWSFETIESGVSFSVDPTTGILSASTATPGDYSVKIVVADAAGATDDYDLQAHFNDTDVQIGDISPTVTTPGGTPVGGSDPGPLTTDKNSTTGVTLPPGASVVWNFDQPAQVGSIDATIRFPGCTGSPQTKLQFSYLDGNGVAHPFRTYDSFGCSNRTINIELANTIVWDVPAGWVLTGYCNVGVPDIISSIVWTNNGGEACIGGQYIGAMNPSAYATATKMGFWKATSRIASTSRYSHVRSYAKVSASTGIPSWRYVDGLVVSGLKLEIVNGPATGSFLADLILH